MRTPSPRGDGHRKAANRFQGSWVPNDLTAPDGQSDWEKGVAGDADGRNLVLRETGSTVLVCRRRSITRGRSRAQAGKREERLESLLLPLTITCCPHSGRAAQTYGLRGSG